MTSLHKKKKSHTLDNHGIRRDQSIKTGIRKQYLILPEGTSEYGT
jgi:hypothetical protein